MFCNNCGTQIEDGVAFCPECGTSTAPAAPTAVETPVTVAEPATDETPVTATAPVTPETPVAETPVYQAPANEMPYQQTAGAYTYTYVTGPNVDVYATISLICGIISIVIGFLGSIMFGVFGALFGLVAGIVAIVLGINAKKMSNGTKGAGGFICAIIGLVFSALFAIGCGTCGACSNCGICGVCEENFDVDLGYACYGCVGGECKAASDADDILEYIYYWD